VSALPAGLAALRLPDGAVLMAFDAPVDAAHALSDAEREVALAVVSGATNAEIATRRGTSPRTVANLVARAFRKLGVGSRRELAARAEELGLA
jgi:DNA-binding CsgD family transcriptional regulator